MTAVTPPLIATLQHAIGLDRPTLISIEGHGSISIYPHQRTYTTDICDWDSVPFNESGGIRVSSVVWGTAPQGSMPVSELQWLTAYHHASRTAAAQPLARGLVKLLHWPELSDLPDMLVPPVVRMCALLWRKPTASTLMARVLGADPAQTEALLRVLRSFGYLEIATGFADRTEDDPQAQVALAASGRALPTARGSVISKLWQRLLGG